MFVFTFVLIDSVVELWGEASSSCEKNFFSSKMFYFAKPFSLKSDQQFLISSYNINKHKRKTSIQAVWVEGIARIIILSRTCYWYHENEVLGSFTTHQITLEVLDNERLLLLKNVKGKKCRCDHIWWLIVHHEFYRMWWFFFQNRDKGWAGQICIS